MNIANVTVQIFRQIAVRVVGVLIGLLYGIFELEAVVVGRGGGSVVHTVQLVAVQGKGQVIDKPVAACPRLPVALQAENVPVPVIARHFLREAVGVGAVAVGCGQHAVQVIVAELIPVRGGFSIRLPRHAADVPVITGSCAVVVLQALRELSADPRQPVAQVTNKKQSLKQKKTESRIESYCSLLVYSIKYIALFS